MASVVSTAAFHVGDMHGSDKEVYRSFGTLCEMLVDRGVDTSSLAHVTPRDVVALAAGRPVFHVDLPSCGTRIIYNMNPRFKLAAIRKLITPAPAPAPTDDIPTTEPVEQEPEQLDSEGQEQEQSGGAAAEIHTYILITKDKPIHNAVKGILDAQTANMQIQLFELRELQFNISHHTLVPKHEPIRDDTTIHSILKTYSLRSRFHLPLILSTDPMARYLALRPGQLVKITRFSPSSGTYVLYRCCQKAA